VKRGIDIENPDFTHGRVQCIKNEGIIIKSASSSRTTRNKCREERSFFWKSEGDEDGLNTIASRVAGTSRI